MEGPKQLKDDEGHMYLQISQDDDANSWPGDVSVNHENVNVIEDPYKALSDSIEVKVEKAISSPFGRKSSIFRVQEKFHKLNDRAYSPAVVSIGPLHHGKTNLQAMEPIKLIYMYNLLYQRTGAIFEKQYGDQVIEKNKESLERNIEEGISIPAIGLKSSNIEECSGNKRKIDKESEPNTGGWLALLRTCAAFVKRKEEEARKCYSEPITLKSDDFVQMMLIDGLFLIALFGRKLKLFEMDGYDPLFSKIGDLSSLYGDILLLENQIPMIILFGLLDILEIEGQKVEMINVIALDFFQVVVPKEGEAFEKSLECRGKHLLDLLANTFHPSMGNKQVVYSKCTNYVRKLFKKFHTTPEIAQTTLFDSIKVIPNATEMKRSGIKFKKGSTTGSFLDIKFNSKNGELEIPPIFIHDVSEIFFRNVIATEQCSSGETSYMSSYAFFMDSLIDSPEDARILISNGIIKNRLGSDEDVSNLFNKLCCNVMVLDYYYSGMCEELDMFCRKEMNIWKATIKRDYCSSPCATVSVIAAFVLLLLTVTSTVFAIIPVVRPS